MASEPSFFASREDLLRHAASVVGDDDLDRAAALFGVELDRRSSRLARAPALVRGLDTVADRVAQEMDERLGEALEDDAVELGALPAHDELDLLAQRGGDVANRARQASGDRRDRQCPHLDRCVLQLVDEPLAVIELVGDVLARRYAVAAEHVLETPPVQDGLADEVEESVDLLRRDANAAPFSDGGDDVDSVRDLAWECRRHDGRAVGGPCTSRAELLQQAGRRARFRPAMCRRSASAARSSGSDEPQRKLSRFANALEHVFDRVRERLRVIEAEHARRRP